MRVIFLDIDGVLNGHDWDEDAASNRIRPECVAMLNRIVSATGAQIVLSSAWRYMILKGAMTRLGFDYLLRTHGGCGLHVIDTTEPDVTMGADERGQQIANWLATHDPVDSYVVLDDEDYGITKRHPAVITESTIGLTREDSDKAIAILTARLAR